jgi:hypothetical protein
MEKKKLKLSIKGSSQKTFSSIEQAKSKSKNTVVIEKKSSKFQGKSQFSKTNNSSFVPNRNISSKQIILAGLYQHPLLQILKKEN